MPAEAFVRAVAKGDYDNAAADYNEVFRLDPKLESATTQQDVALERLAKQLASQMRKRPPGSRFAPHRNRSESQSTSDAREMKNPSNGSQEAILEGKSASGFCGVARL
jgi:hypothetical protein